MSMDFILQGTIVLLVTLMSVELSHWIGDHGWGHPITKVLVGVGLFVWHIYRELQVQIQRQRT